jgi:hypothetical protein
MAEHTTHYDDSECGRGPPAAEPAAATVPACHYVLIMISCTMSSAVCWSPLTADVTKPSSAGPCASYNRSRKRRSRVTVTPPN